MSNVVSSLALPPRVVIAASGIGYYGSALDGAAAVDEDSPKGTGFLSDVSAITEAAYQPASTAGVRVVLLRLAPVLSQQGGMLGTCPCGTRR